MIRFKEYLVEAQDGVMTSVEAKASISPRRWNTIIKHKWFVDHMRVAQTIGVPIGFKVNKKQYFDEVMVAHGPIGDSKLRRMLRFSFIRDKLSNIDLYQNWRDETIGGHIKWNHIKQLKKTGD